MPDSIIVRVFGVPMACSKGIVDAWRNVANQARGQLAARFGDRVIVEYYDLMAPEMDRFPEVLKKVAEGAEVPLVFIGDDLFSSGGKVSVPAIARRVSESLAK